MKNQTNYIKHQIARNKIELSRAEQIREEIRENVNNNLYDDWLVLM